MGRVDGKVAIVTGAAMGLGRAQAQLLASEGANVVVTDIAEAEGEATLASLARPGLFLRHDVSSESDWERVAAATVERFGGLDILVNNAAIMIVGSIEELSLEDWRRVQAVNSDGVFLGCRASVRLMKQRGGGSIVNMASTAAQRGYAGGSAYASTKFALSALSQCWAAELRPEDVRVIAEPGRYMTSDAGYFVCRVIGTTTRGGKRWMHWDAGLFGGVIETTEGLKYKIRTDRSGPDTAWNVAGPTCDSVDVVMREEPLPSDLQEGDFIYIRNAGAYTTAYASEFNGFPLPEVRVFESKSK